MEEKHDSIVAQLYEADLWPTPVPTQSNPAEQRQSNFSTANADFTSRLDAIESRLTEYEASNALGQQSGTISDVPESGTDPLPSSAKRRGSWDVQNILERTDRLQNRVDELEADALDGDRLTEEVDAILEGRLFRPPSGLRRKATGGNADAPHPPLSEPLGDVVRKLDSDLDILCSGLVGLPSADDLASQVGALRRETEVLKEKMLSVRYVVNLCLSLIYPAPRAVIIRPRSVARSTSQSRATDEQNHERT